MTTTTTTNGITYKKWSGEAIFWAVTLSVTLLWILFSASTLFAKGEWGWGIFNLVLFLVFLPIDVLLVLGHQRVAYNRAINRKAELLLIESDAYIDQARELGDRKEWDFAYQALDDARQVFVEFDELPERDYRFWTLKAPGVV